MITEVSAHLIVFGWGFVPAVAYLTYGITYNAWEQRWAQKFRGPKPEDSKWSDDKYHDTDLEAFYHRLIEDCRERILWRIVVVIPFVAGVAVWLVWWLIYLSVGWLG